MIKNRFNTRYSIVLLFILTIFFIGIPIACAEIPPIPNTFSGTVKFVNSSGGYDVPSGTLIEALIDNVTKGSFTVVTSGIYGIDVIGASSDDSKTITFVVDNINTEQQAIFDVNAPSPATLNLVVNISENLPPSAGVKGDFNNNGRVDIGDVAKVAYMVVGEVAEDMGADFNVNGDVDIGDAAKIAFYLVGKVSEL